MKVSLIPIKNSGWDFLNQTYPHFLYCTISLNLLWPNHLKLSDIVRIDERRLPFCCFIYFAINPFNLQRLQKVYVGLFCCISGIACISLSLVDGQGSSVQVLSCPKPSRTGYNKITSDKEFEHLVYTELYEPSNGAGPGRIYISHDSSIYACLKPSKNNYI